MPHSKLTHMQLQWRHCDDAMI